MYDITGYHEAQSLTDVFKLMQADPTARLVAGGTDVLVKTRAAAPHYAGTTLIGISRIAALKGCSFESDGTLKIGALMTFDEIEHDSLIQTHLGLLSQAVSLVGGPQTRRMGTIGGNICNAGPAADSAPSLFTYNAQIEIQSESNVRQVPIAQFYVGPGRTILKPGEIVTSIKIAPEDYQGFVGHYTKFARRKALDIANLSCAALIKVNDEQRIEDLRICFGAAGPVPLRTPQAEAYAKHQPINRAVLKTIGEYCLKDTQTISDWRNSKDFRDHLVTVLPGRDILVALRGDYDEAIG